MTEFEQYLEKLHEEANERAYIALKTQRNYQPDSYGADAFVEGYVRGYVQGYMPGCMESATEFFQNNDTIDDEIKMQIFFDEKVKNVKQFVTEFLSYYNMND